MSRPDQHGSAPGPEDKTPCPALCRGRPKSLSHATGGPAGQGGTVLAKHILTSIDIERARTEGAHPWNPKSGSLKSPLSRALGMERAIVVHMVLPPGRESFVPHTHETEEEWIYILSGRGTSDIDGTAIPVSAGDLIGFTAPSVMHHLRNTGTEDLVYLMGGECHDAEVSNFPTLGKRKVRFGTDIRVYDIDAGRD